MEGGNKMVRMIIWCNHSHHLSSNAAVKWYLLTELFVITRPYNKNHSNGQTPIDKCHSPTFFIHMSRWNYVLSDDVQSKNKSKVDTFKYLEIPLFSSYLLAVKHLLMSRYNIIFLSSSRKQHSILYGFSLLW